MGARQDFLEKDVALAQPLEQGDRIGAQNLAGLLHFGDGSDGDLPRLLDRRAGGLFQILQRFADRAGREFAGIGDGAGNIRTVRNDRL